MKRLADGEPYLTFFGPATRSGCDDAAHATPRSRSSPAARAASASASRARWRATAGTSRSCGMRAADGRRRRARRAAAARRRRSHYVAADYRESARSRARSSTRCATRYGAVNALVNNAGRAPRVRADLLEATEDSFEELLRTNLQGPYFLTQAIARDQVERRRAGPVVRARRSCSSRRCRRRWRRPTAASTASARRACRWPRGCSPLRLAEHGIPVYEVRPGHHRHRHDRRRQARSTTAASPTASCPSAAGASRTTSAASSRRCCAATCPYATGTVINVDGGLSVPRL